jgi:hypothetical protein
MYRVEKRDGSETVEFGTVTELAEWAIRERVFDHRTGGVPYPTRLEDVYLGSRNHDPGTDYYVIDRFAGWEVTPDHLAALRTEKVRLQAEAEQAEINAGWRTVEEIPYMDNSVEAIQEDKNGNRRRVTVKPPSGDACF